MFCSLPQRKLTSERVLCFHIQYRRTENQLPTSLHIWGRQCILRLCTIVLKTFFTHTRKLPTRMLPMAETMTFTEFFRNLLGPGLRRVWPFLKKGCITFLASFHVVEKKYLHTFRLKLSEQYICSLRWQKKRKKRGMQCRFSGKVIVLFLGLRDSFCVTHFPTRILIREAPTVGLPLVLLRTKDI